LDPPGFPTRFSSLRCPKAGEIMATSGHEAKNT
jgi:hypothetical protein